MKSFIRKLLAAVGLALALSTPAHAGIPVVDIASLVQIGLSYTAQLQQYATQIQQFETMKSQLTTSANQLQSMTGARGMGGLFNNPEVQSALPPDWQSAYASVRSGPSFGAERARLPVSNDPSINAIYDSVAASNATMTDFFSKSNARIQQIQSLQSQIDSASDPAAKQDLANRMLTEQNSIQATSQLLEILKRKQEQDITQAREAAHRSFVCNEFKNC